MIRCRGTDDLAARFSRFSATLLAAGSITLGTAGCGTMTLPPRLSTAERAQIEGVRFDAVVGVTTEHAGHIRKDVVAILQDTGLFRKVADLDELSEPPDLVVMVTELHGGKAIIPLLTIVTLGVLPTFFTDDVGYGLVIRSPTEKGRVSIDYRFARACRLHPAPDFQATFAAPEDVIVKKMEYYRAGGSDRHLRDIAGVLEVSGKEIDRDYIGDWAERLGLSEIWQRVLKGLKS